LIIERTDKKYEKGSKYVDVELGQVKKRVSTIEEKNGYEQHQIDDLKLAVIRLEKKVDELEKIIIKKDGIIEGLKMTRTERK
jgi:hypothetical protein